MSERPIRVVMFAGGGVAHTSGGIGTFIRYLEDEWGRTSAPPEIRVIDTRGERGTRLMLYRMVSAIWTLVGLRITRKVDLLHIHMAAYGSAVRKGMLACLGRALGIPVIMHMHGSNFRGFYAKLPAAGQRAVRFALNQARYVIVLGSGWRDFLVSEVGLPPRKVVIIFNGVPAPQPGPVAERAPEAPPHIAFLGHLGARKGVPELLAAFQLPQLRSRQWTATVAGDGEVQRFRDAVAAAGLTQRVAVPGWLDRKSASSLLRNSDIFVLPSHFEAMPIAVLEAMAHGVAVITTPVGALPEFLTDGETALLVAPGEPEQLADAIAHLLDAPEERARLGATGQQVFATGFDIRVTAARVLALYRSVLYRTPSTVLPDVATPTLGRATRSDATVDSD